MVTQVVERPGSQLVTLSYVTRGVRSGEDYFPVFLGDALLAGARDERGAAIYPVALGALVPRVGTSTSGTTISLTCQANELERAVGLLAALVLRPMFDKGYMRPVRTRSRLDLEGMNAHYSDWWLALRHEGESFTIDDDAIVAKLAGADQAALLAAHRELFQPIDSALIVVGDVQVARAQQVLVSAFGSWVGAPSVAKAQASSPSAIAPPPRERQSRRIILHESPGYPWLTVVQDAPPVDSPDVVPFELLSAHLAGSGWSLLMEALRVQRGHAYSAHGRLVTVPSRGRYLFLETKVSEATLAEDVSEVLRTLESVRATPISAQALAGAKARYRSNLAGFLASGAGVASYLAQVHLGLLPPLAEVQSRLDTLTSVDLQRVAQRYLNPESATIEVSGAASGAMAALSKLGEMDP
jgi:predicted Zn-dependent peptidase